MYVNWAANLTVVVATLAVLALCVLVHYEGLVLTQRRIARESGHRRIKVLHAMFLLILVHVVEIWIFGMAYGLLLRWPECGSIAGSAVPLHLFDYVYFSAMSYTTVGFGDLAPVGPIRFLSATEALVGLMLITWSASFTYLEMERYWRDR